MEGKGRKFLDDQVYHPLVDPSENLAGPKVVRRFADEITFRLFKCFSRLGIFPSVKFMFSPVLGVFLRARTFYKKYTIVGEYTGVVEPLRWNISAALQLSDSVYDLLVLPDSRDSLCIVPEPYTGYVRYISGINNYKEESIKKRNVEALGHSIETKLRLFVVAIKDIRKGDMFYLDYNAGPEALYPTEDFK
eukprot:Protomagalhaensia_wolfi_Nauph_80__2572@NODE_2724_length_1005_cov_5_303313_g2132_i0_p1_GENE_NODE_2724_length_1005_cov_5_303313_g2132_i0NODE_2724_length_1005_cov_5_303313_g2132_i0_p1_ORF_typecomplete_len191_score29_03SET/PF00856_28/0_41_NODE_2724_length_1005_cov_5_303313_g2132_i0274846